MERFDYIIVGGGSAGCVLANRLSEDPSIRVLLLEAGPEDSNPLIKVPKGYGKTLTDSRLIWEFPVEPEERTAGNVWVSGRTLGGSSSVNGMIYNRGLPSDYLEMTKIGLSDWGWESMLECYRKIEGHELGASPTRGGDGPLKISAAIYRHPICDRVIQAGVQMGLKPVEDFNEPNDDARIGYLPTTTHGGRRVSSAHAFLHPARRRPNLAVRTGSEVVRVDHENRRAVGVSVRTMGAIQQIRADAEVILSAGAINSPKLLQLSGIGPGDHLQSLGIPVLHDCPAVGANLQDHAGYMLQYHLRRRTGHNRDLAGINMALSLIRYLLNRRGPMASPAYEVGLTLKSNPGVARPDVYILVSPFSMHFEGLKVVLDKDPGLQFLIEPLRPTSRGSVRIQSADSSEPPRIRRNYLATDQDRRVAIAAVRAGRLLAQQGALRDVIKLESTPGTETQSDDQILDAVCRNACTVYHPIGTCAMGTEERAVIDPRARVRTIDRLRVVDCSMLPVMVAGNTNAPAMAMAWRAADLILEDRRSLV